MSLKFTFFLLFLPIILLAQPQKSALLAEINKDVWIPFLEGVNNNEPERYNGVHSENFYWVLAGNKTRIMNFKEYVEDSRQVMERRAQKGTKTELQVRFLERNIDHEFASEKCVIKYVSTEAGKDPVTAYSIAQVFSRKENGAWKKIVQYAHTEPVVATVFENAQPISNP